MSDPADSAPARRAYEAYAATVGGVAVNGDVLPPWDDLTRKVQEGWRSAAAEGSTAYAEKNRARAAGAARQMTDREGVGGPTERLAQAFHESYERLAPEFGYKTREASAKPWAEVPEPNRKLMQAVVADLTRGGHLHAGRAEPTYRDRNDNYVPPKLYLDGAPRYVEVSPARSWFDLDMATHLLGTARVLLAAPEPENPVWQAQRANWLRSHLEALENYCRTPPTARVALGGADEDNGGEAGSWFWADVSGNGTHWSRFEGHRVQVDIELHTYNRREVNEWKGRDEIRAEGEWKLRLNRQEMGDGYMGADVHATLRRIDNTVRELMDHPALDHTNPRPYAEQLTGRRVFYREQPAIIERTVLSRGCVLLTPVGSEKFAPPVWHAAEQRDGREYDDSEDGEALVELDSPYVWWWRDEAPGEAEWLAARDARRLAEAAGQESRTAAKLASWSEAGHLADGTPALVAPVGTVKTVGKPMAIAWESDGTMHLDFGATNAEAPDPGGVKVHGAVIGVESGDPVEVWVEPDEDPEGTPVEREP